MKRTLSFMLSFLLMSVSASAQDYGQAATVRIWDNASAPHDNGITTPEEEPQPHRVANVSTAELYLFPADTTRHAPTGLSVVVCPGGGYTRLSIDHEGFQVAQWLAANGISAAVLKYRMPNGHPEVPLEDAEQALRLLRGEVPGAEICHGDKVGIMGFSAGGHLAAYASTMGTVRPDFAVLFYPVITAHPGHQGSFNCLIGEANRTAETDARYSLENRVTEQTPPTLLLLSDNDRTVPPVSSSRYYNALKEHGIRASMHIYPTGGHGWGIRDSFRYKAEWQAALLDWLKACEE